MLREYVNNCVIAYILFFKKNYYICFNHMIVIICSLKWHT